MQRKPFWKLLITGVGYMILGNFMGTVMTVALSMFADVTFVTVILFALTLFVFYSLVFTAAFKDGQRERLMVKNHRVDSPIKGRWALIGVIMFAIMCIPSLILFFDALLGRKDNVRKEKISAFRSKNNACFIVFQQGQHLTKGKTL